MDLITIILIIVFISKVLKKGQAEKDRIQKNTTQHNPWDQVAKQTNANRSAYRSNSSENEKWKQAARENIEKARKRAEEKFREIEAEALGEMHKQNTYEMPKQNVRTTPAYEQMNLQQVQKNMQTSSHKHQENRSAMQQVHTGRMEARNTTILQRAKSNTNEDKVDVTLETMEAEHNHSERVSPATHHHPEDVIPESTLGTIEDLMIKGYDGSLCFERDFVGEAMDMISRFTVPSDVPDFSEREIA